MRGRTNKMAFNLLCVMRNLKLYTLKEVFLISFESNLNFCQVKIIISPALHNNHGKYV